MQETRLWDNEILLHQADQAAVVPTNVHSWLSTRDLPLDLGRNLVVRTFISQRLIVPQFGTTLIIAFCLPYIFNFQMEIAISLSHTHTLQVG